jgi:tetratricopeptide (TPR) repeat protein
MPEEHGLWRELVTALAEAQNDAAAEADLTEALTVLGEESPSRFGLLSLRAEVRARLGNASGAYADTEAAYGGGASNEQTLAAALERYRATLKGTNADAYRTTGLTLAQLLPSVGQGDRAVDVLAELVQTHPSDGLCRTCLARALEQQGEWARSLPHWRTAARLESGEARVDALLALARAAEAAGTPRDALADVAAAYESAPEPRLRETLARLSEAAGAFDRLATLAEEEAASGDGPAVHAALLRAGSHWLQAGDAARAIAVLTRASEKSPTDMECTALLADAYVMAGRGEQAALALSHAVASFKGRRSKELAPLYHRPARISHDSGDLTREMAWLSTALEMDGQNGVVAAELADVAIQLSQLDVAQRALRAITMLKGPTPVSKALAYQRLGEIAQVQGDTKKAVLLLKRALDEDPSLDSARELLDELDR